MSSMSTFLFALFREEGVGKNDVPKIKRYINPYHGAWDPVGTFQGEGFLELQRGGAEVPWNPVWYFLESEMFTKPMSE